MCCYAVLSNQILYEIPQNKIEEKIPPSTEKIIQEAEKTLVLKEEVKNPNTINLNKKRDEKIEIIKNGSGIKTTDQPNE